MKKSELGWLRTQIADLAAQGVAIRKQIRAAFARARYDLWNEKRNIGDEARWVLLAYAFLRDVPYRVVEPTATVPCHIHCTEEAWHKDIAGHIATYAKKDEAGVFAWLRVPETIDRKACRLYAEADGWQARRERLAAGAARRQQAAE